MRRFGEIHENREVERNLTYVNQESDVTNNVTNNGKKVPSNTELKAAIADYFRKLAEVNNENEVAK